MKYANQTEFAELAGVSKAAVSKAIKKGKIIKDPDLGIDVSHPVNHQYLNCENNSRTRRDSEGARPGPKKAYPKPKPLKKVQPKPKKLPPASDKTINISELDESDIYELLDINGDLAGMDRSTADLRKVIEQVRALEISREKARKELIKRSTVQMFINNLYKIDTGELLTLGDKISPLVAAICGIDDNEVIHKVNEAVEKEIYKIVAHIKRRMSDFLKKIEAEALNETD